jgi:hypothetical protein
LASLLLWLKSLAFWPAYFIILILVGIIFKTIFAKSLPLLKSIVVYIFMAIGCLLITLFHIMQFPMILALFFTVILIVVTKIRLQYSKSKER